MALISDEDWEDLLEDICQGACTPIIGPDAHTPWIDSNKDLSIKWAKEYGYPLDDYTQLDRVAQFLTIPIDKGSKKDELFPKIKLKQYIKNAKVPKFSGKDFYYNPYSVLVDLNLPVYLTTNYDHFMENAITDKGKKPISEFCRWDEKLHKSAEFEESVLVDDVERKFKEFKVTKDPLVYHLHGDINVVNSMVLTDSDHIEFVINLNKEGDAVVFHSEIRKALYKNSLLFLGYNINDSSFRLLLQCLIRVYTADKEKKSIAVQIPPDNLIKKSTENNKKGKRQNLTNAALEYIQRYTKESFKLNIYFGSMNDFCKELRDRWDNYKCR